jgi:DHA2 family methylenomycin A resistance protein-like MFS transporter
MRIGLAAICLGFAMITLDATIVNVALGPMVADLGGSLAGAQWIVNAYTLSFAALLLTAGALGDRVGARAAFLVGLAIFAAGSAACSLAGSLAALIAARVAQGVGAAWLMPASLALIAHGFPEPEERRAALAIWGAASGIGLASGPILGGVLVSAVGWPAIFLVNLPVAAVAAALLLHGVEETPRHRHPLDPPGQVLGVAALAMLTAGFVVAGGDGWGAPTTVALLAAGAGATAAFILTERAVRHPMVDPVLFAEPSFAIAVTIGALFNFCLYGALFCLAIDLHGAHGLDALDTGLALLPVTVVTGASAFASGRMIARFGAWPAIGAGLAAGVTGAVLVAVAPSGAPLGVLVAAGSVLGLTALAMPAMTVVAMSTAPAQRIGLASGVFNAARQTGGALGVAVLGALLAGGHGGAPTLHRAFAGVAVAYAAGIALTLLGSARAVAVTTPSRTAAG